jgi:hypothetical protein
VQGDSLVSNSSHQVSPPLLCSLDAHFSLPSITLDLRLSLHHVIFALSPLLSLLPSITIHSHLTQVSIDGTSYPGNVHTVAQPFDSPICQISNISPVKGADNPSLNCGLNTEPATMIVPANPGLVMEFYWGNLVGANVSIFWFPTCSSVA